MHRGIVGRYLAIIFTVFVGYFRQISSLERLPGCYLACYGYLDLTSLDIHTRHEHSATFVVVLIFE